MQIATKKLIASLGVVLMGFGIAGAANANSMTKMSGHNLMVKTYPGDTSLQVRAINASGRILSSKCINLGAPGWKSTGPLGVNIARVTVVYFTKQSCSGNAKSATKSVPKDKRDNFWFDAPPSHPHRR